MFRVNLLLCYVKYLYSPKPIAVRMLPVVSFVFHLVLRRLLHFLWVFRKEEATGHHL